MEIKAAVFDIDDTLYDSKTKRFIPSAIKALGILKDHGIVTIIATGRPPHTAFAVCDEGFEPNYIVATNGNVIIKDHKVIYEKSFDSKLCLDLYKYCKEHELGLVFKGTDFIYEYIYSPAFEKFYHKTKDSAKKVLKGNFTIKDDNRFIGVCIACNESQREMFNHDFASRCQAIKIDDESADVMLYGVSKKNAVETVLNMCGISRNELIAFGDNNNDIEMIKFAKIGVAMGNGSEELKKEADFVAPNIDDDGIYRSLKQFGLINE